MPGVRATNWEAGSPGSLCGGHSIRVRTLNPCLSDYIAMKDISCRKDSSKLSRGKMAEYVNGMEATKCMRQGGCGRPGWKSRRVTLYDMSQHGKGIGKRVGMKKFDGENRYEPGRNEEQIETARMRG